MPRAGAQHANKPAIEIDAPWARASAGMTASGAGYMTMRNTGAAGDRLIAASTPAAARTELHTMAMDGDVMRMRRVEAIDIPAGGTAELKPGGLHVMLFGLKQPLKDGDRIPLTLRFEHAGELTVQLGVRAAGAGAPGAMMEHGQGGGGQGMPMPMRR
jgi:copper(I)-binding protein